MNKKLNLIFFIFLINIIPSFSQESSNSLASLKTSSKGAIDFIKGIPDMLKGMITEQCSDKAKYSAKFFNDLDKSVLVSIYGYLSHMGIENKEETPVITNQEIKSYDSFKVEDKNLCHTKVVIKLENGETIFDRSSNISEDDKDAFFYHTYRLNGIPKAEFLGPGYYGGPYGMTKDFEGVFFNNTKKSGTVKFKKNEKNYEVTLPPDSFSILSAPMGTADIRGKSSFFNFNFLNNEINIPVQAEGIGQIYKVGKRGQEKNITLPLTYRYEAFDEKDQIKIGIQGFNMGNYNPTGISKIEITVPKKLAPIRDISPVECIINYKTQGEDQKVYSGNSLWAIYASKDLTIKQKLKIGQNSIFIVRPQITENSIAMPENSKLAGQGKAYLYVLSLTTQNDSEAEKFLDNIIKNQEIEKKITVNISTIDTLPAPNIALNAIKKQEVILQDQQKISLTATLILVDTFLSYSGQIQPQRKYEVTDATLDFGDLASVITPYLDFEKVDKNQKTIIIKKLIETDLPNWVKLFNSKSISKEEKELFINLAKPIDQSKFKNFVPDDLKTFLKTYGYKNLFDGDNLSKFGIFALRSILFGPISFLNLPINQGYGFNSYLYS